MPILKCNCKHAEQDRLHGYKLRVHNPMKGGKKFRCTVCLNEREAFNIEDYKTRKENGK